MWCEILRKGIVGVGGGAKGGTTRRVDVGVDRRGVVALVERMAHCGPRARPSAPYLASIFSASAVNTIASRRGPP